MGDWISLFPLTRKLLELLKKKIILFFQIHFFVRSKNCGTTKASNFPLEKYIPLRLFHITDVGGVFKISPLFIIATS